MRMAMWLNEAWWTALDLLCATATCQWLATSCTNTQNNVYTQCGVPYWKTKYYLLTGLDIEPFLALICLIDSFTYFLIWYFMLLAHAIEWVTAKVEHCVNPFAKKPCKYVVRWARHQKYFHVKEWWVNSTEALVWIFLCNNQLKVFTNKYMI